MAPARRVVSIRHFDGTLSLATLSILRGNNTIKRLRCLRCVKEFGHIQIGEPLTWLMTSQ